MPKTRNAKAALAKLQQSLSSREAADIGAAKYIEMLDEPDVNDSVRFPDGFAAGETQFVYARRYGKFTTTTGVAYVEFNPSMCNGGPWSYYSTNITDETSVFSTGSTSSAVNPEKTDLQSTKSIFRLVAAILRVKCTNSGITDAEGRHCAWKSNDTATQSGSTYNNVSTFMGLNNLLDVKDEGKVSWYPRSITESEFADTSGDWMVNGNSLLAGQLCWAGSFHANAKIEYQAYAVYEAIPSNISRSVRSAFNAGPPSGMLDRVARFLSQAPENWNIHLPADKAPAEERNTFLERIGRIARKGNEVYQSSKPLFELASILL